MIFNNQLISERYPRINEADSNEKLKNTESETEYYSLHIQNKVMNIRILMTLAGEQNTPVFLGMFYERSGKNTSNYTLWIPVMKKCFREMKWREFYG